jgi:hypothetical protein
MSQLPPVNQYEIEKEFHDFIMRPEHYGFNAEFARQLEHKDDSTVSNWHSPHVPASKSWLYKAADKLDRCFRARPAVGRKALAILNRIGAQYAAPIANDYSMDAAYFNFKALVKEHEDTGGKAEELEAARERLAVMIARAGRPIPVGEMQPM